MDNAPAMSMADGSVGNAQGQTLPEPAIKAANKAVNQYWDQHAKNLAAQPGGIDLLHQIIQQHATGGLNDNPTIQPAQGIASPAQVTPEGNIQQGGLLSWIGGHSTDDLLRRLVKVSNIQKSSSESSLQGAETGATVQKIDAGQPADIALPQAQIGLLQSQKKQVQQQIEGLTPEQQASAIGTYNSALIQQHNELQKGITDQITSTATAIDQLVKNTPLLNKAPGSPYYDTLTALQSRLQGLTNQGKNVVQSFKDLQLKNPSMNSKQSTGGLQTFNVGGVTYNIPSNKVAAFKKAKGL